MSIVNVTQIAPSATSWLIVSHFGRKPASGGSPDRDNKETISSKEVIGAFWNESRRLLMDVVDSFSSVRSVVEIVIEYR